MDKTLIIAEAGVNHNGDIKLVKELIDIASSAGADYVKFQAFKAENIVSKDTKKAEYQKKNINDGDDNQFNMLKKLEFKLDWYDEIIDYCKEKNIKFLTTPFDFESIEVVDKYIDLYKIPSGEITNLPYIEKIASKGKRIILSTGMCYLSEIEATINVLIKNGVERKNITVLHCNTEYPTPINDTNLSAMLTIKDALKVNIGYSDHTEGIEVPIAAVAMGAKVIEKHFTIDKTLPGPDHKASLDKKELTQMVKGIRKIEKALGNGIKQPSESEKRNISVMRKSIIAKNNINKGDRFTIDNICIKRPGTGISPMKWNDVIDTKSNYDFVIDDIIKL
jgi:N,N'-diacetyllegionaminate synthase